jgi:hypothetical protein
MIKFTGRQEERNKILGIAREILNDRSAQSSVINLLGESGIGKVCLSILGRTIQVAIHSCLNYFFPV